MVAKRTLLAAGLVALSALVAAAPSIDGEFLGGDDKHLLLNHVLINHPSWENALKLFTLQAQRDLYQPIPLLTFALEFKLVRLLSLPLSGDGTGAATYLFHVTNIVLHTVNALLVFGLLLRWHGRVGIPCLAAILFAVHPVGVETYAWLNGRMTLLSAMFSLLAVASMDDLLVKRCRRYAVYVLLAVVLAMCSKVRVELPLLMLIPLLWRRVRPASTWWWTFGAACALTGFFTWLNFSTTAEEGMFEGGEVLKGSRAARTLITLGWYFWSYVWPVHLSPHYPTDRLVEWSHPMIPMAILRVGLAALLVGIASRWSRVGWLGMAWFLVSVASTLPIIPARNLMAADRYVYLANVGFYWMTAAGIVILIEKARRRFPSRDRRGVARFLTGAALFILAGSALLILSWRGSRFYENDVERASRVAVLYPTEAGSWDRVAWALYGRAAYREAIDTEMKELQHHPDSMAGKAHQLIGMAKNRLHEAEEGLAHLRAAVRILPDDAKAHTRLARALSEQGFHLEAVESYRRAVKLNPAFNPAVISLAQLLRELGNAAEAAKYYQLSLSNNAYDLTATLALAEMDMTERRYDQAATRLRQLLSWMPANVIARTNLGVCLAQTGRNPEAVAEYHRALEDEPGSPTASANLAALLAAAGRPDEADRILREALRIHPTDLTLLIAYQDFCVDAGRPAAALSAWLKAVGNEPKSSAMVGWCAWSAVLAGDWGAARELLQTEKFIPPTGLARMAVALAKLHEGDPEPAMAWIQSLPTSSVDPPDARVRFKRALIDYGAAHPDEPWLYYLTALLLHAEGDPRAMAALDVFDQLCQTEACKARSLELRRRQSIP